MKYEKKTLVMVMLEKSTVSDYEIVDGSVEANAYELYEEYGRKYPTNYETNGDQIFTFSAMGMIPETDEEREALETASEEGKAEEIFDGWEGDREKHIYFKADYNGWGGPENFADESIDVIRNGRQVYLSYNDTIPHPELGTVEAKVTINEKDYSISIPAEFDEDGDPYRTGDLGTITDENGKTFEVGDDDVPAAPNMLWIDIAEEVVPNRA